jgi:hypothetical protein
MFKIKLLVIINYLAFISWSNWTEIKPSSLTETFYQRKGRQKEVMHFFCGELAHNCALFNDFTFKDIKYL